MKYHYPRVMQLIPLPKNIKVEIKESGDPKGEYFDAEAEGWVCMLALIEDKGKQDEETFTGTELWAIDPFGDGDILHVGEYRFVPRGSVASGF